MELTSNLEKNMEKRYNSCDFLYLMKYIFLKI